MSLNPADLENALSELRDERPSSAAENRLRQALSRPDRRSSRTRVFATLAVAAAGAGMLLLPRQASGIGWAEARERTAKAIATHVTSFDSQGNVVGERWTDGRRYAHYSLGRKNAVNLEWRFDGKRRFWYLGMIPLKAVNARPTATVSTARRVSRFDVENPIDRLLKSPTVRVVRQESIETPEGPRVRYELETYESRFSHRHDIVFVDSRTGLIRRTLFGSGSEAKIDYPSSLPSEVFEPHAQVVKDVETYDVDRQWPIVKARMRNGLGRAKGVTLRLVVLDGAGSLWIFWTGHLPDGRLSHPLRLPGIPTERAYAPKRLTSSFRGTRQVSILKAGGQRLGGMALIPKVRVGDDVEELRIPTPTGDAVFHNVPILRISSISDFGLY